MQQYDEWLIDFQVQHGRKPSDKEVAEAAKAGFALSSGLSRQKNSKFRQVLSKVGLGDLKFSWFLVLYGQHKREYDTCCAGRCCIRTA